MLAGKSWGWSRWSFQLQKQLRKGSKMLRLLLYQIEKGLAQSIDSSDGTLVPSNIVLIAIATLLAQGR